MRILRRNNSGFTLVEVLVAIVIMLVGLLGLLQAVNVATEHNARDQYRDEAVLLAEQWMGNLKSRPFNQISGVSSPAFHDRQVNSQMRGRHLPFTVKRVCTSLGGENTAKLAVEVAWTYKQQSYKHAVTSLRAD